MAIDFFFFFFFFSSIPVEKNSLRLLGTSACCTLPPETASVCYLFLFVFVVVVAVVGGFL